MITNFWKETGWLCLNHDVPVPMVLMHGKTDFYACPRYMLRDEAHPDGHEALETACANRLSFDDTIRIIDAFQNIVTDHIANDIFFRYEGFSFSVGSLQVKVLKYEAKKMELGVLNLRAVKQY